ncbi:MAG: citramalate synthase [Proteobacteria bacterium]|nr:citramalate synthase [Pseudomonadota bacterium]
MTDDTYISLFDSTLRDGAQTQGVDFATADKLAIAEALDGLGLDYVEGGWPGANPTDDAFFAELPELSTARLVAFGMTRRPGRSAGNDPVLAALVNSKARDVCLVGKASDFQVEVALGIALDENLAMIRDSVAHLAKTKDQVLFDAEHFFDGYISDPGYALECLRAAQQAGARWVVLCDTNGGTLPREIGRIVETVTAEIPGRQVAIHCHNDTENAVANSLVAIEAGARQIQGTLNGLGERCGNANLVSLIPTLMLKTDYEIGVSEDRLKDLTQVSHMLDERLNRAPNRTAAYVGDSAFAHKAGLHASAVEKDPRTYEHIDPALVGNRRHVVISDQAGRSSMLARFRELDIDVEVAADKLGSLIETVKAREFEGYAYDGAEASFELLARRALGEVPHFFKLSRFRIIDDRRWNARGELVTESEATVTIEVGGTVHMEVAAGNGPVNALDSAIRKALLPLYPQLEDMRLVDYKVRILTPQAGTRAVTRVMIESADRTGRRWTTVGVSPNIIDASFNALHDGITWKLMQEGAEVPGPAT